MKYSLNPRLYGSLAFPIIPDSLYEHSLTAIGIAAWMTTKPTGHVFNLNDLPNHPNDSVGETLGAVDELAESGHLLTHETVVLS